MDVLALVSAAAGVVGAIGVPIAFLQLRNERAHAEIHEAADPRLVQQLGDSSLFAPAARYRGFAAGMVDRRAESASLMRMVKDGRSVIAVEGIAGVGKTTLVAHVSREVGRIREVQWVFCDEKLPSLNLLSLAKALASTTEPRTALPLRTAIARRVSASDLADAVIGHLAQRRLLLVLDGFEAVRDPDFDALLDRLEHSQTASSLVLTSRVRVQRVHAGPLTARLELGGLSARDTRTLLRERDVPVDEEMARIVWEHAGVGNPLALTLFAGRALDTNPEELVLNLPSPADDMDAWIAPVFDALPSASQAVAKIIAFAYEPVSPDVLKAVAAPTQTDDAVADLTARFLVKANAGRFEMHSAVRDYITEKTTAADQADLATRFNAYYQSQARTVFLDGLGEDEPSYGLLYVESFPDYFADAERHMRFVDDLLDRLADNGFTLARDEKILVLGSGDGTHDPGFAKHGLDVTDLEIQPEIADLGRAKAASLAARIRYLVADMTEPLPDEIPDHVMAAVFNIGSSFGYEDEDELNAAVFRHAVRVLRDGAPFVFEYVNGPHWEDKRVQRQIDVTTLPNGSTRTEVSITNPEARTSLTMVGLQRPDGTAGWFRHFMHYYRLDEITAMMAAAGLRPVAVYGAKGGRVTSEPFDEQGSEAMVIIAALDTAL